MRRRRSKRWGFVLLLQNRSAKKQAARAQRSPLSAGLWNSRKRISNTTAAAANASSVAKGKGAGEEDGAERDARQLRSQAGRARPRSRIDEQQQGWGRDAGEGESFLLLKRKQNEIEGQEHPDRGQRGAVRVRRGNMSCGEI